MHSKNYFFICSFIFSFCFLKIAFKSGKASNKRLLKIELFLNISFTFSVISSVLSFNTSVVVAFSLEIILKEVILSAINIINKPSRYTN